MSLNKRARKKSVGKMSNQKEYPKLTMDQAIDLVIVGRVQKDSRRDWLYFVAWLQKNYEIECPKR